MQPRSNSDAEHHLLRAYLKDLRGGRKRASEPVTAEQILDLGFPPGVERPGTEEADRRLADSTVELLRDATKDLDEPVGIVMRHWLFTPGLVDKRYKAATGELESLKTKKYTTVSYPRNLLARHGLDDLARAFAPYLPQLHAQLPPEELTPRAVSYGFTLRSLSLDYSIDPDDPREATARTVLEIECHRDRVRVVPRRHNWTGHGTIGPPIVADPNQRVLFVQHEDGSLGPIQETEFAYWYVYLGRPYNTGEQAVIDLSQSFRDESQAMRPFLRYLIEQAETDWTLVMAVSLPLVCERKGLTFEAYGAQGRRDHVYVPSGDNPPAARPDIVIDRTASLVKATWTSRDPLYRHWYRIDWSKPPRSGD